MQETLSLPAFFPPHAYSHLNGATSSALSTPFVSAPSSPGRMGASGFYFSAPTSPNWAHRNLELEDGAYTRSDCASAVPFAWEEKPGIPKGRLEAHGEEEQPSSFLVSSGSDFEFSSRFSEFQDPPMSPTPMSCARELFYNGQIRPLRLPPRLEQPRQLASEEMFADSSFFERRGPPSCNSSCTIPCSPLKQGCLLKGALCGISSPLDQVLDPFAVALEEMRKQDYNGTSHRRTRSLSPLRNFQLVEDSSSKFSLQDVLSRDSSLDEKEECKGPRRSSPKPSKKWSLKNLLHRRNEAEDKYSSSRASSVRSSSSMEASPGDKSNSRASSRHANSSMEASSGEKQSLRGSGRSESSQSSPDLSGGDDKGKNKPSAAPMNSNALRKKVPHRPSRGSLSPHELHYMVHRAHTEELRKRTFLPYRQGLLGCLGFTSKSYRAVSTISKTLQPVSG